MVKQAKKSEQITPTLSIVYDYDQKLTKISEFESAFKEALGNKEGIARFGSFVLPMDDALVLASLDISGRTYFAFDAELPAERLGTMETETVREFFMGFASGAGMNLHIRQIAGNNTHHIVEAMFKAVAKAMDQADVRNEVIK